MLPKSYEMNGAGVMGLQTPLSPCLLCSRHTGLLLSPRTSSSSFVLAVPSAWDNPPWLSAFLTPSLFQTSAPMSPPRGTLL